LFRKLGARSRAEVVAKGLVVVLGFIHIFFLVGARRLTVILNWLWSYFAFRASTRLITGTPEQN